MLCLWPRLHREPGPFAWSTSAYGNCVPDFGSRMGCAFRNGLQAEIASHSESSFWDTLSARSFVGKAHPIPSAYSGMRFPAVVHLETAAQFERLFRDAVSAVPCHLESASHFEHSVWDMVSAGAANRKACPRSARPRGNTLLSSPYRSTSLSHVGSTVCRMPAVCSFFASIPAERTSLMVKRSRG